MGASDFPFKKVTDLAAYVSSLFESVTLTPEQMHAYQNMAVEFVLAHPFCALFIDLGLGKTCISLTAILNLVTAFEANHILVVAPKRVANETWPTEIRTWQHTAPLSFVHVRDEDVVDAVNAAGKRERSLIKAEIEDSCHWSSVNKASTSKKVEEGLKSQLNKARIANARSIAAKKAVRDHFKNNPATIHIINREQVEFLVDSWGRDWPYDVVILDESSSYKDHTSGRFNALKRVRPLMKRMIQLTATPAAETYLHLFAQIYLLDQGERFGRTITRFRYDYFDYNNYSRVYKLKPGAEEKIAEKITDITLTMKAEDYLDLEKPVMLMERVILSPDQKKLYDTMQRDFIVALPTGEEVEAETAAALSQKLLQMASGVLYDTIYEDDGDGGLKKKRVVHQLHDHKIEKLQTIVEEAQGETILVAYWHDASLARLNAAFPQAVVMDAKGECVKAWNARKIPILLVHPQSAGHGLNLQHGGRRIVFFDIPWSLELYLQLIGRLARQGQKLVVMVHHLIAEGTIDEDVVTALIGKRDAQEILFVLLKIFRARLINNSTKGCNNPCKMNYSEL
jgi:hypothetical protein